MSSALCLVLGLFSLMQDMSALAHFPFVDPNVSLFHPTASDSWFSALPFCLEEEMSKAGVRRA